jgi:hypothetical protein
LQELDRGAAADVLGDSLLTTAIEQGCSETTQAAVYAHARRMADEPFVTDLPNPSSFISEGTDGERQKGKKEEWNRKVTTKARALLSEGYDKLK